MRMYLGVSVFPTTLLLSLSYKRVCHTGSRQGQRVAPPLAIAIAHPLGKHTTRPVHCGSWC